MAAGLLTKGPPVEAKWVFFLRIAIIFISVLVLALSAWSMHLHVAPYSATSSSSSSSSGSSSSGCSVYGYSFCKRSTDDATLERRQYSAYYYTSISSAPAMMIFSVRMAGLICSGA
jgi:hypothetical protein